MVYNREKSSNNVVLVGRSDFHHRTWRRLWTPVAAAAMSLQSCPTLHDPMDCSLPGSSVHGIFQARVLEWGAIAFSNQDVERLCLQGHAGSHCGEKLMKIRLVRESGQFAKGLKDNTRELQLHPSMRKGQQSVLFCLKQRCHNSHTKT